MIHLVLGPLGFALLRGEFPLLWSFSDSPTDEEKKDDTIEPPAEAAQRARAEAKAQADLNGVEVTSPAGGEEESAPVEEDDSWMNDPVGIAGGDGKARKRKNKKK